VFNALLGFFEEHQASNALAALKNALALKAKVLRGGTWSEVDSKDIVPGDADARLVSGDYLSVDQAPLTGESLPVSKKPGDIIYSGSIAKQGEMEAVVTATAGKTFFGRTASLVQSAGATSHFPRAAMMRIGDFLIAIAAVLAVASPTFARGQHPAAGGIRAGLAGRLRASRDAGGTVGDNGARRQAAGPREGDCLAPRVD
jgi:H+-transporting ATPase